MNRRQFMAGLLATGFALAADAPASPRPAPRVRLSGFDVQPLSGKTPTSMVVLLHGFGGNGEQMRPFATAWAQQLPDAVFVLPDAPEQCRDNTDPASRQWFATRALDPDDAARVAEIRTTEPILNEHIDAKLAQYGLRDGQLVIAGFSQGAMMALHAGVHRRLPCAGVVSYNGMLVDADGLRRGGIVRPPVFAAHGRQDTVVPYARLAVLAHALRRARFDVETASYITGHSITPGGLRAGGEFMRRQLATNHRKFNFRFQ